VNSIAYSLPLRRDYVSELRLLVAQRARFKCSLNPDRGSHVTALAPLLNSVVSGRDILTQVERASTGGKGGLQGGQRWASFDKLWVLKTATSHVRRLPPSTLLFDDIEV
jgi:hypothetical protein